MGNEAMTFTWDGREFNQLDHPYNATLTNERAIEVPIARAFVAGCEGDGLELGNVLGHYGRIAPRRIVDRWEIASGVDNLDVFEIEGHYDWIVSVSTIEHVRYPENPYGAEAALTYLRGLLRPNGRMLITIGLGQNATLDEFLEAESNSWDASLTGAHIRVLVRERGDTPAHNVWTALRDFDMPYEYAYGPTHGANAVWIGEWGPDL